MSPKSASVTLFRRRRHRVVPLLVVGALVAAGIGAVWYRNGDEASSQRPRAVPPCDISREILERVWRGYVPGRSGDVLAVEAAPNQFGTRHSSPFPYHQDVPLVLYGPGFVKSGYTSEEPATVADLAPTFAHLLEFDRLGQVDGRVLKDALLPRAAEKMPKLIVTIVWDGGGDNVLEQWPEAWPHLRAMMDRGATFTRATVGSSPSITPSIHATIGTGVFPRRHGIADTKIRVRGKIIDSWQGKSPKFLRSPTLGDLWDLANDNVPLVGMMARDAWHLGMIGAGSYFAGGDEDIAVMDALGRTEFITNDRYYRLPAYFSDLDGLKEAVEEVDLRDGEADNKWLGNVVVPYDAKVRYTPGWAIYQTQKLLELVENEGFGSDELADLLYVNYKISDLAGHEWNMVEPEVRDALAEQDRQLARLIQALDRLVGQRNYVIALTADHGMTPYPEVTNGWSIETQDLTRDIEARFDRVTPKKPLILSNRGYQFMLDHEEMRRNGVSAEDVAAYVRDYRMAENVTPTNKVLPRFEGRTDEHLYLTAMTPRQWRDALGCARRRDDAQEARRSSPQPRRRIRSASTRHRKSGLPTT